MAYSTDDLVTAVRRLAYLPDASDITAAEILTRADEELVTIVADCMKSAREGFWLTHEDQALSPSVKSYPIPRRALGRGVVGVQMVTSDGVAFTIPQIDPVVGWNGRTVTINSYCYSFQADNIVFPSPPPSGYSLRVQYMRETNRLVPTSSCAAIEYASSTTSLHVTGSPSTWPVGYYLDIVRGDAPFDLSYVDLVLSGGAGTTTILLDPATPIVTADFVDLSTYPNDRADYLCPRDTTCYPPLPIAYQPVLEAAVAAQVAESLKDSETADMLGRRLERRKRAAADITEPRNQEGSRPITRIRSPLRQTVGIGRRWR